jgi:high-affinity K+ transport system ATPase subunit B
LATLNVYSNPFFRRVRQVKRDGKWENIDAKYLVPTDVVALNAGAAVPADCTIIAGHIDVDQAALTGESLPVTMMAGGQPKVRGTKVAIINLRIQSECDLYRFLTTRPPTLRFTPLF